MSDRISRARIDQVYDAMVNGELVTKEQLALARVSQKSLGGSVGQILVKRRFIDEDALRAFFMENLSIESVSLKGVELDQQLSNAVPDSLVKEYNFVPVAKDGDVVILAFSDVLNIGRLCSAEGVNFVMEAVLVTAAELQDAMNAMYGGSVAASSKKKASASSPAAKSLGNVQVKVVRTADEDTQASDADDSRAREHIAKAVNTIIARAMQHDASDIHMEPQEGDTRVRVRIDGLLKEIDVLQKKMHGAVVSRLKVMANMDIAERRIPQDGRVRLEVQGSVVDVRISTMPTTHGEKVVMRLLVQDVILTLEDLGLSAADKDRFSKLIERPYGIFLVTGPTGSGKTSTLYAALQRLNSQEHNIVSIEDPVENEVYGINQAQVNNRAGMTFAAALRSMLRQDPDIIMIGEIRDRETAQMAVRAALTGHLVFSTLHTNTALGAVERLADMEVERFLIGSALLGVMAQRLVRRVCDACKVEVDPDPELLRALRLESWDGSVVQGKGCAQCRMTGYQGRVGIFELITSSPQLNDAIVRGAPEEELRDLVRSLGVADVRTDGLAKVRAGMTTMEEVLRVTQEG